MVVLLSSSSKHQLAEKTGVAFSFSFSFVIVCAGVYVTFLFH